jgi:hypothetical protein
MGRFGNGKFYYYQKVTIMSKINLTQNDLESNLATTDEFWTTFNDNISFNPIWKATFSAMDADNWKKYLFDNNTSHINILIKNFPILKNEFPVGFGLGFIFTNYRMIYNSDKALYSIPIMNIMKYDTQGFNTSLSARIVYIDGEKKYIHPKLILDPSIYKNVIEKNHFEKLNETQVYLLKQKITDLEQLGLNCPSIDFGESSEKKVVEQNIGIEKTESSLKVIRGSLIGAISLIVLSFLVLVVGNTDNSKSSSKKSIGADCLPRSIKSHSMSGSTLTVQLTTNYSVNAEYCAADIMYNAFNIAKTCYPNISRLVVNYSIEFTNKYGEKKQADLGTFEPNLSTLRRYPSDHMYKAGEPTTLFNIYNVFTSNGFR